MNKQTWRIVLLGAVLAAISFGDFTLAGGRKPKSDSAVKADKPPKRTPIDMIRNYRDQFEGFNLTEDQMIKIDGFIDICEAEIKKSGDFEDRDLRHAAFAAVSKLNEDVQSILNDAQKNQWADKQQSARIDRFKEPYMNPALKLTSEQTRKIDELIAEMKKEMPAVSIGAQPDKESYQKIFQVYRDAGEKMKAVLTPEQQKLVPEMRLKRSSRGGDESTSSSKN